jgi:hypothetical protein
MTSVAASNALETGTMTGRKTKSSKFGPEYRIRLDLDVPLEFAFAWCTDYTPEDGKLEGESYRRKVVERTPRRVVFEDLEETKDGWIWSRDVVRLRPPNRWHMDGVGNAREVTADYMLTRLPDGRTQLDLRWRRRPLIPAAAKLTKAQREASTLRAWKRFRAAMERDYRRRRGQKGR